MTPFEWKFWVFGWANANYAYIFGWKKIKGRLWIRQLGRSVKR